MYHQTWLPTVSFLSILMPLRTSLGPVQKHLVMGIAWDPQDQLILPSLSFSTFPPVEGSPGSCPLSFCSAVLPNPSSSCSAFSQCLWIPAYSKQTHLYSHSYNEILLPHPGLKHAPSSPLGSCSFYCCLGSSVIILDHFFRTLWCNHLVLEGWIQFWFWLLAIT